MVSVGSKDTGTLQLRNLNAACFTSCPGKAGDLLMRKSDRNANGSVRLVLAVLLRQVPEHGDDAASHRGVRSARDAGLARGSTPGDFAGNHESQLGLVPHERAEVGHGCGADVRCIERFGHGEPLGLVEKREFAEYVAWTEHRECCFLPFLRDAVDPHVAGFEQVNRVA